LSVADVAAGWDQRSGRGTLAVCGPDEDTLTLAWSAAEAARAAAGMTAREIDGLWWGTARPPMPEGPSLAYLSCALGLGDGVNGLLASGSTHAGVDALTAAWDALAGGSTTCALVVLSDALVPGPGTGAERSTGAAAVALVLTPDGGTARLVARAVRTRPLLDRYRGEGQPGTGDPYDPRLFRERELLPSVAGAVQALESPPPDGARWSVPDPDGRLGGAVARKVGATDVASADVFARVGDTGAAAPLLGILGALDAAGPAVVVATGGGRASALVLEVDHPVPGAAAAVATLDGGTRGTRPVTYASVLRARRQLQPMAEPVPMGIPPGSAAFVRGNEELLALEGKKCANCGTIAVPPTVHPVCPNCGSAKGTTVPLTRTGVVHTFVVNHTMPAPFEAPLPLVVVDLDDGARVLLQGMPEDAAALSIGDRVALELRRYAIERGAPVYGFKVRRAVGAANGSGNGSAPGAAAEPAPAAAGRGDS
jgi:hydroxymethylglutaryl-CoA synthase